MIAVINTRMIIFEGIPGSGKTTTSQLLHKYFLKNEIASNNYIEGCEHPIDLPFYAYLSLSEYDALILKYQKQAQWLELNSIVEDKYVLSPYKIPEPYPRNDMLIEYLRSKEFCYSSKPIVSFDTFRKVFYTRFKKYVDKMINTNEITVFESVLFQHQIHDINRLYPHIKDCEIIEHLVTIANILKPLKPVLFYIEQNSVKDSLEHTAFIRSKPKWAAEENIAYYEKRKVLELNAMKKIPFASVVLDNTNYNWDEMFDIILHTLSL
jgi:DNA polymerase III delta prime subunit